jgi:hypothetical protein
MVKLEMVSTIALAIVAALVLIGLARLVLNSWTYLTLIAAAVVAGYFVLSQMQKEWEHR